MKKHWKVILVLSLVLNLTSIYVAIKALEYRSHINEFLYKYLNLISEFSERDEYEFENKLLVSETVVPGRVVFFGTQVTTNWEVGKLFEGYEAINRGVDHQWAHGFLLRFRPDVLKLRPEAVVIEISSYNFRPQHSVAELQDHVASMADLAAYHGIVPVLTTVITPVTGTEVFEHPDYAIADSVAVYNRWIQAFADSNGLPLADINAAVVDATGGLDSTLATSKVDLNTAGYEAISDVVRAALESTTAKEGTEPGGKQ